MHKIIRCYSPSKDNGVLAANKNELAARFRKGVGAGAGVVILGAGAVSWLSARLRRAAALVGRCCQLIVRGVVSWLRRLRTFLFQPVGCQQVVGFCLAIWVYAGGWCIFFELLPI